MNYTSSDRVRSIIAGRKEAVNQSNAIIRLGETDTAWNPKGVKFFIQGPGRVKYEQDADGEITAKVAE